MSDKNIEMMKKLIESKKQNSKQGSTLRPDKNIGSKRKGVKNNKQGGLFD
jgi:hypothetical protein